MTNIEDEIYVNQNRKHRKLKIELQKPHNKVPAPSVAVLTCNSGKTSGDKS
jgi:hypothetical protein